MNENEINGELKEFYEQGSPLHSTPKELIESTIGRIAETTCGYTISVLAGLAFLLAILPQFYSMFDAIHKLADQDPGKLPSLFLLFEALFGGFSGLLINLHIFGFFVCGVGLRTARSWARPLLIYLLTYLAFIILFEIRYWGPVMPTGEGWISVFLEFGILALGSWLLILFRKKNLLFIRVCAILNLVLAGLLTLTLIRHFLYLPYLPGDRHIQYLSLFFFAVLLVETIGTVHVFIPAFRSAAKTKIRGEELEDRN